MKLIRIILIIPILIVVSIAFIAYGCFDDNDKDVYWYDSFK